MRPGQNKRMRGRNNNRKGPNPLTRSYESNGPDVKIRGTAHHIAEKYLQLARDAHSSGDPVMAESYLQHAEHYFRLIAAAQQAQAQAQVGYQRPAGEAEPDDSEEDDEVGGPMDRFASPIERVQPAPAQQPYQQQPYAQQPQPYQGQPQPYAERQPAQDRQPSGERAERPERQDRPERGPRQFDRNANGRDRWQRQERQPREQREPRNEQPRERVAEEAEAPGLPAFITAPPRVVAPIEPVAEAPAVDAVAAAPVDAGEEAGGFHLRPRRRRRRTAAEDEGATPVQEAPIGE